LSIGAEERGLVRRAFGELLRYEIQEVLTSLKAPEELRRTSTLYEKISTELSSLRVEVMVVFFIR
jgi:hypothetical protein